MFKAFKMIMEGLMYLFSLLAAICLLGYGAYLGIHLHAYAQGCFYLIFGIGLVNLTHGAIDRDEDKRNGKDAR